MMSCYWLAPAIGRKPDGLSALGLAAVIIALVDPQQVSSIGFILSFTILTGLLLFVKPLQFLPARWLNADPLLAMPEPRWKRGLRQLAWYCWDLVLISFVAFCMSGPIISYFFGTVSPIPIIGDIVIVPLTFCVVACGFASIVLGSFIEPLSYVFNELATLCVKGMLDMVDLMYVVPYAYAEEVYLPLPMMLAYYAFMLWFSTKLPKLLAPKPIEQTGPITRLEF